MKCDSHQTRRSGIQLLIGEIRAPAFEVFFRQFERMQDGTLNGRNVRQRAA